MQEHVAKHLRLSLLLWLLLLALIFPYAVGYYERQQAFQWEKMVQPHWEVVSSNTMVDATGQVVSGDKIEQQNLAALPVEDVEPDSSLPPESPQHKTVADATPVEAAPVQAVPVQAAAVEEKPAKKTAPRKKNNPLHFNLPEDLYQNQAAEWHEKKPLEVPDFFAPKKESPNRVQLGGRLIIDEDKKKQQPDVDYLDTVKGAEVNISISTQ